MFTHAPADLSSLPLPKRFTKTKSSKKKLMFIIYFKEDNFCQLMVYFERKVDEWRIR